MADKGAKIVIQDTQEYLTTGYAHLSDTNIYQELPADPTIELNNRIQQFLLHRHDEGFLDDATYKYLKLEGEPRTQLLYFLKKIHKDPITVRPIVSCINGITEKISAFLDHYLQPLVTRTPAYLKNTAELLDLIKSTSIQSTSILCTVDVKSLYLSIPQSEGTQACLTHLEETQTLPYPKRPPNTYSK